MKMLAAFLSILFSASSFGASAILNPTSKLILNFEDKTGLEIQNVKLMPRLLCWSVMYDPAEDYTHSSINESDTIFLTDSSLNGKTITSHLQHMNDTFLEAPKKDRYTTMQRCGVSVSLTVESKTQGVIELTPLFDIKSEKKNFDMTPELEQGAPGNYAIKLIDGGSVYDPATNSRVKICGIGLFKNIRGTLKQVNKSRHFELKNCKG